MTATGQTPSDVALGILGHKVDALTSAVERLTVTVAGQAREAAEARVEFAVAIAEVRGVLNGIEGRVGRVEDAAAPEHEHPELSERQDAQDKRIDELYERDRYTWLIGILVTVIGAVAAAVLK
jgi:hypothetical protein